MCYFEYGDKEINYLKSKDKKLAEVIDRIESAWIIFLRLLSIPS